MTTATRPAFDEFAHDWQHERVYGRRRACAMPASHRRTCRRCGLIQFQSGNMLGAEYQDTNRPPVRCEDRTDGR